MVRLLIEPIPPIMCCLPPYQTLDTNRNQSGSPRPCRQSFHTGGVTQSNKSRLYWWHAMIVLQISPWMRVAKGQYVVNNDIVILWLKGALACRMYYPFKEMNTSDTLPWCCRFPSRCFAGYHIVCSMSLWLPPYPYHIPLFLLNGSTQ